MAGKKAIKRISKEAENQIVELRKEIAYETKDFPIETLVSKYESSDIIIPDEYQRRFIWKSPDKCRFIESVILGLPIPPMFLSDNFDGVLEIIDGAQRTQTLEQFLNNDLKLSGLKKIDKLNKYKFENLPDHYQRKIRNTTLRVIVLNENTNHETRSEIFDRINTAGKLAKPAETRRGKFSKTEFKAFIEECCDNSLFKELCQMSELSLKRFEDQELVLRFFAYLDNYKLFRHDVDSFLDDYFEEHKNDFEKDRMFSEFKCMLEFVKKYFKLGFAKSETVKYVPRVRFEAISIGVALALRKNPDVIPESMDWLESEEFSNHVRTHASNSQTRLAGRVEYVRDCILNAPYTDEV